MLIKKRTAQRRVADLPIDLVLYNSVDDSTLTGTTSSFLHDISYSGAGLILSKIFIAPYHLFYDPSDNDEQVLCMEKNGPENSDRIIIPIKPIWFRQGENDLKGYFQMGVEFMAPPEDQDIINLEKLALKCFEVRENLLTKLIRIFH